MAVKTTPTRRARTASKPYCYDCRKTVRSLTEHRATATHRAATTSVRSTGGKGSHAYRPPVMGYSAAAHDAWYEEQYLATLPPSIDDLFPTEIRDPLPERVATRGATPGPCEKCGKTFRTPAGASWHAVNNTDCERWARKSRAA